MKTDPERNPPMTDKTDRDSRAIEREGRTGVSREVYPDRCRRRPRVVDRLRRIENHLVDAGFDGCEPSGPGDRALIETRSLIEEATT